MPIVKPEDASRELNKELESDVEAAMEEENKRSEPTSRPSRKRSGGKKQGSAARKSHKKQYFETDRGDVYSSPRSNPMAINAHAVVSPDARGMKKHRLYVPIPLSFELGSIASGHSSKFQQRLTQRSSRPGAQQSLFEPGKSFFDLCPPLVQSDSDDATTEEEPHSGDEVAFEGKRFHYLDSFVEPSPVHCCALEPRPSGSMPQCCQNGLSESSLSMALSLREPILTPSSSTSSFGDLFQQDGSLEINPDTIFSENDGDWQIGGDDLDIDTEFAMLAR